MTLPIASRTTATTTTAATSDDRATHAASSLLAMPPEIRRAIVEQIDELPTLSLLAQTCTDMNALLTMHAEPRLNPVPYFSRALQGARSDDRLASIQQSLAIVEQFRQVVDAGHWIAHAAALNQRHPGEGSMLTLTLLDPGTVPADSAAVATLLRWLHAQGDLVTDWTRSVVPRLHLLEDFPASWQTATVVACLRGAFTLARAEADADAGHALHDALLALALKTAATLPSHARHGLTCQLVQDEPVIGPHSASAFGGLLDGLMADLARFHWRPQALAPLVRTLTRLMGEDGHADPVMLRRLLANTEALLQLTPGRHWREKPAFLLDYLLALWRLTSTPAGVGMELQRGACDSVWVRAGFFTPHYWAVLQRAGGQRSIAELKAALASTTPASALPSTACIVS